MKTIAVSLLSLLFAQNTLAAEMFCGFFSDRTPVTIEYNTKDSVVITFDKVKMIAKITSRYENGLTNLQGCVETSMCPTDIEINYSGENTDLRVTDFLTYAEITGVFKGEKIERGLGYCK